MHEKEGKERSTVAAAGKKVTSRKQAIAIGLSEARPRRRQSAAGEEGGREEGNGQEGRREAGHRPRKQPS